MCRGQPRFVRAARHEVRVHDHLERLLLDQLRLCGDRAAQRVLRGLGWRRTAQQRALHQLQPGHVRRAVLAVPAAGVSTRADAVAAVPGAQGRRCDTQSPCHGGDRQGWLELASLPRRFGSGKAGSLVGFARSEGVRLGRHATMVRFTGPGGNWIFEHAASPNRLRSAESPKCSGDTP